MAEKDLSSRIALTVPNFMMALSQLSETDLISTLPKQIVARYAERFGLESRPVPFSWVDDPVRVVASKAAAADAGIAWMFDVIKRCMSQNRKVIKRRKPKQTEPRSAS
ncbi:MAG: hypothetical protein HC855_11740 [Rhizobiales bacterium]|nr:hypothetical protein [Hyphomicrobiales bacterium]